jgi:hypothetical protein
MPKPIEIGERQYHVVLVPSAPVPVGGCLVYVPVEWVKPADFGVEALMSIYECVDGSDNAADGARSSGHPQLALSGTQRIPRGDLAIGQVERVDRPPDLSEL